jgi:hypothetical protein
MAVARAGAIVLAGHFVVFVLVMLLAGLRPSGPEPDCDGAVLWGCLSPDEQASIALALVLGLAMLVCGAVALVIAVAAAITEPDQAIRGACVVTALSGCVAVACALSVIGGSEASPEPGPTPAGSHCVAYSGGSNTCPGG